MGYLAMLHQRVSLPWRFRLLNMVGKSLRSMSLPIARLDEERVCEAAMKETGLTDFGDPHYREGLLRLLESAETDADLHLIGCLAIREVITNALASQLLLMDARKGTPEIFERPLTPNHCAGSAAFRDHLPPPYACRRSCAPRHTSVGAATPVTQRR